MTAPETGREIPADELATGLRSDAASINSLRRKTPRDVEDAVRYTAAADFIEAQAARIASLEAERARTVEPDGEVLAILDDHDGYPRWALVHFPIGAVRKLCGLSEWQYARREARALASEKGGQADG